MFMNECEQVFIIRKYGQLICAKCAHYHSCDSSCPTSQKTQINLKELGFFFWNEHNFADPLNKNICKKKCTAKTLMCPTCLYKLQPAPETWWCPDRCFFYFFFKSKWKTTSKDRCPARVKTLQEQISRPIDADTHCFRYASLLKSSFNSNRFYLYKTANSSAMTNKNTTEEMQIWRERLKIVFSPKMCRTPQSIDFFVTDAKCARRQKTFSFPPEHTDISKPGMSNEKKLWQ